MQSAEKPANTRLDPRCLELQPPREPGELRQIVREASRALAFLDVVRLEELAISCQKLTSDPGSLSPAALVLGARQAAPDMAVFARVLDATRANLDVMRRLRDLRNGRLEFNPSESLHGHH